MGKQPWRPGSAPPSLDDLRELYRKLNEMDARLVRMQGVIEMMSLRMSEDRKLMGAIASNMDALVVMFGDLPLPQDMRCRAKD